MHTIMVIAGGLVLLAAFCLLGRARSGQAGMARAAVAFIPVWLVLAIVNLTVGVVSAGYTVLQELPILVPVFGVPAIAAWLVARRANTSVV